MSKCFVCHRNIFFIALPICKSDFWRSALTAYKISGIKGFSFYGQSLDNIRLSTVIFRFLYFVRRHSRHTFNLCAAALLVGSSFSTILNIYLFLSCNTSMGLRNMLQIGDNGYPMKQSSKVNRVAYLTISLFGSTLVQY